MSSQGCEREGLEPLDLPEKKEYTHRAHRFPGKFHPPLIAHIIEEYADEDDVIADPMGGSGTTAVEAVVDNKDVICNDIDPLCALMTRAKTHPVDSTELLEVGEQIVDGVSRFPEEGDIPEEEARAEVKANVEGKPFQVPINLFHWFEPYVAVGYSRLLKSAYDVLDDESDRMNDAVRTSLAAMVRRISRADPEPVSGLEVTKVRKKQLEKGIDFDVESSFNQVLNRLADGYDQLETVNDLGNADVFEADAREFSELCEQSQLDPTMVITSPPYCNAIEYSRRHRLEYEWLGLFNGSQIDDPREERLDTSREFVGSVTPLQETLQELGEVPHREVRELTANIESDGHERKANLLRKYFHDAYEWIEEVHKALPEDGQFCLIIGPSTSYGRKVDTPQYLMDIAEENGFEVKSRRRYQLHNNKMQYPTDGATTETESLIRFTVN
jgi:DNA modification methylase